MTHRQPQRELNPHGGLNYFYGGISSEFPLMNQLALPGSESVFGVSQKPPMCVHTSPSQGGFWWKGLCVCWHHSLFDLQGASLQVYSWEGVLDLENEKYVVLVFYLERTLLLLLLFWSICPKYQILFADKLQLLSLGPIHLLLIRRNRVTNMIIF